MYIQHLNQCPIEPNMIVVCHLKKPSFILTYVTTNERFNSYPDNPEHVGAWRLKLKKQEFSKEKLSMSNKGTVKGIKSLTFLNANKAELIKQKLTSKLNQ